MKPARAFLRRPRVLVGAGLAALALSGSGVAGCYFGNEGLSPPTRGFYFPTGLTVSPGGRALYVANSDFDLQYNGGTVQVLDLPRLRSRALEIQAAFAAGAPAAEACGALGINEEALLYPGPCAPLDAADFVKRSAIIGAFASDVLLVHEPLPEPALISLEGPCVLSSGGGESSIDSDGHARLFVPVRGDPSVTYFEVADDRPEVSGRQPCQDGDDSCFLLNCGADDGGRCVAKHRVGESASSENRDLKLASEPVGIAADPSGVNIVVTHQTERSVSLISNRWGEPRPTLQYNLGNLGDGPTELAAVPPPRLVEVVKAIAAQRSGCSDGINHEPSFLLTYLATPQLDLLRTQEDEYAGAPRSFLSVSSATSIDILSNGVDSRGIAVDASERQACEQGCGVALACLAACTEIPVRMYVAHRVPNALLIGEVRTTLVERESAPKTEEDRWGAVYDTITLRDTVPLAAYPSRVEVGEVIGADGARHKRVFVAAFDSGQVFAYDPEARAMDKVIRTGRGPHALAFDTGVLESGEPYSFLYVSHFTDSYLGIVDLDARKPSTFGSMIITLGKPVPPRESQ